MSVVKPDFKRWLAPLETSASEIDLPERQAASHRESFRLRVKTCDLIRKRFLQMGLDPTLAASLKLGQDAAAEFDAIPDSEALRTADKEITRNDLISCNDSASRVKDKLYRIAERFYDGSQPDFVNASVMELLAFCIAIEELAFGRAKPFAKTKEQFASR